MPAIYNPTDVDWFKGVLYTSEVVGGTPIVTSFGSLQNISFSDTYQLAELMDPLQLTAHAVGITSREVRGNAAWAKVRTPQFIQMRGGTDAVATRTTWSSLVDDEPGLFNVHCLSPSDGTDIQAYFYHCVAESTNIDWNLRQFAVPNFAFRVFGVGGAAGLLYKLVEAGDQTTSN